MENSELGVKNGEIHWNTDSRVNTYLTVYLSEGWQAGINKKDSTEAECGLRQKRTNHSDHRKHRKRHERLC